MERYNSRENLTGIVTNSILTGGELLMTFALLAGGARWAYSAGYDNLGISLVFTAGCPATFAVNHLLNVGIGVYRHYKNRESGKLEEELFLSQNPSKHQNS